MKNTVVALEGVPSEKIIYGQRREVVPFLGSAGRGDFSQVGIGFRVSEEEAYLWGLAIPHLVLQSWRGMRIFELVERIEHATLCECYYGAAIVVSDWDKKRVESLARQFGGLEKFEPTRQKIVHSSPEPQILDSIIQTFLDNGVKVDVWELREEVAAGRIQRTPLIDGLIKDHKKYVRKLRFEESLLGRLWMRLFK